MDASHRPSVDGGGGLLTTGDVRQSGAESPTAQAVYDEVDRRVGDDEQVAETLVKEERTWTDEAATKATALTFTHQLRPRWISQIENENDILGNSAILLPVFSIDRRAGCGTITTESSMNTCA